MSHLATVTTIHAETASLFWVATMSVAGSLAQASLHATPKRKATQLRRGIPPSTEMGRISKKLVALPEQTTWEDPGKGRASQQTTTPPSGAGLGTESGTVPARLRAVPQRQERDTGSDM